MEVVGEAGPCGPGTWEIPALLRQFWTCCTSIISQIPAQFPQLSCLLGFALPLVPAHPSSLSPTTASLYFGPLPLKLSGCPCVAAAAPARTAGAAERLRWCWQCRDPAGWMHKQTSYTTSTAMLQKEMTTGCYCITLLNNERVFLENTCHLIPLALQTFTTGW